MVFCGSPPSTRTFPRMQFHAALHSFCMSEKTLPRTFCSKQVMALRFPIADNANGRKICSSFQTMWTALAGSIFSGSYSLGKTTSKNSTEETLGSANSVPKGAPLFSPSRYKNPFSKMALLQFFS